MTHRCYSCGRDVRQGNPQMPLHCCLHPRSAVIDWDDQHFWSETALNYYAVQSKTLADLKATIEAWDPDAPGDQQGAFHNINPGVLTNVFALRVMWQDWPQLAFQDVPDEKAITLYGRRVVRDTGNVLGFVPEERTGKIHKRGCGPETRATGACVCFGRAAVRM